MSYTIPLLNLFVHIIEVFFILFFCTINKAKNLNIIEVLPLYLFTFIGVKKCLFFVVLVLFSRSVILYFSVIANAFVLYCSNSL